MKTLAIERAQKVLGYMYAYLCNVKHLLCFSFKFKRSYGGKVFFVLFANIFYRTTRNEFNADRTREKLTWSKSAAIRI